MKIFRFKKDGRTEVGVIYKGEYLLLTSLVGDINELFFKNIGMYELRSHLERHIMPKINMADIEKYLAPVPRPSKIVCVGLNYNDHAREIDAPTPKEPVLFLKATNAYNGPYDNIVLPRGSQETDWEVELAIVISRKASYVDEQDAFDYIAGYTIMNDVTERHYQLDRGGTWDKGKGCDTFAPIGPYLVPTDEIKDSSDLDIWLKVNGVYMQNSNTSNFIFKVPYLISYVSQFMTLYPGDILSTGTPCGIGHGKKPQVYLKAGDVIELGIEGLGEARQVVVGG
jgi:2,4-didehydro-3-deoxy-L-rhamnonate hydrolase